PDNLPVLPTGEARELTERDQQVIGTLLTHPEMSITQIAQHYRHYQQAVRQWVEHLGRALGVPIKAAEVAKHVRTNRETVLTQAGMNPDNPLPVLPMGKHVPQ
ncbi:hypothetical protein ACFT8P_36380, partial [Streptomyces sp. NPDC057101]|uniref:hypothetical protein n=1 Tax=Streptomyces sp. NPDC057101 TaxID=3346020 RepID=UPI0036383BC8